ncbi:MAG: zinc-ribbon protein [Marmoricola sp.]|nr:zinc-ribbon protein [Marmoricola sp.]
MTSPSPNWYPDPTGRFEYRYWDGTAWTEHVSRTGVASADPLMPPPPVEVTPVAPTARAAQAPGAAPEPAKQSFLARASAERAKKLTDRDSFTALALAAAHGDGEALSRLPDAVAAARGLWRGGQFDKTLTEVLVAAIHDVMSDDVFTAEEEARVAGIADALGVPVLSLQQTAPDVFEDVVVGQINAGRLPVLPTPSVLMQQGEVAHGNFGASLMKEQTMREFRGGSQGISIPIGMGIRYRTSSMRGRSVVVGTQLVAEDSGLLTVTSKRTIFTGQKKTLEFRRDRLVGIEQFRDGIRLNVSNRQAASLFKLAPGASPTILAALISATG